MEGIDSNKPIAIIHVVDGEIVGTHRAGKTPIPTGQYAMHSIEKQTAGAAPDFIEIVRRLVKNGLSTSLIDDARTALDSLEGK